MSSKKKTKQQQASARKKPDKIQTANEFIKSFLIALALALLIKATIIEAYKIPTPSMESTLLAGDFILGNKFIYGIHIPFTNIRLPAFREPKRGDIIIFRPPHSPKENYVKRCIGLPGDTIEIRLKRIYINGELYKDSAFAQFLSRAIVPANHPLSDPYVEAQYKYGVSNDGHRPYQPFRDNSGKIIVPERKYFMMGDNRDNSLDSRMWGFVDRENIMGQALLIHWSWDIHDQNAPEANWRNPISLVSNVAYNVVNFYKRVNWDRLGTLPK
jgi:signal peptidase I